MKVTPLVLVLACAVSGDAIPMLVPSVEGSLVAREFDDAQNATDLDLSEENAIDVDITAQNVTDEWTGTPNATDGDVYGQNHTHGEYPEWDGTQNATDEYGKLSFSNMSDLREY